MAKLRADQTSNGQGVLPPAGRLVIAPGIVTGAAGTLTSGRATFYPHPVASGVYDALICQVTTAQSGGTVTAKLAVYPDDGSGGMPLTSNGPIVSVAVALTTAGVVIGALSSSWTATSGLYWMCFVYNATTAPTTGPATQCVTACSYAIPQTTSNFTSRIRGIIRSGITDAPTDATTTANITLSGNPDIPIIGIRRAT